MPTSSNINYEQRLLYNKYTINNIFNENIGDSRDGVSLSHQNGLGKKKQKKNMKTSNSMKNGPVYCLMNYTFFSINLVLLQTMKPLFLHNHANKNSLQLLIFSFLPLNTGVLRIKNFSLYATHS